MENIFSQALKKIVDALTIEKIEYMIVGGFAVSYHNRARTTNDIDLILQISYRDVGKILTYFPEWMEFKESFESDIKRGMLFNLTDFNTGIRYDFMTLQDTEYGKVAFERREKVSFWGVQCNISSREDLIISKLKWYQLSQSEKQMDDLRFLFIDKTLDWDYIRDWTSKLKLSTYDYWGNKVNVSEDAARRQIAIIRSFSPEKRLKIAIDFADMGISQTHSWIRSRYPEFSDYEVKLEFVRLMYYQTGEMPELQWKHFKSTMEKIIRKDWILRFRNMMEEKKWSYDYVASLGGFKNGKVIEATISRGLPSFAKLAVVVFEQSKKAQTEK
ncbi:MAG: DUF6036 family nucleotidyltransferase [Bacteroidia bacterium]